MQQHEKNSDKLAEIPKGTSKQTIKNQPKNKFEFEVSPAKKGTCPNPSCNKQNCFRYYKNLSREFGICDHKNKCGYHNDPNKKSPGERKEMYNSIQNNYTSKNEIQPVIIYPSDEYIKKVIANQNTNFHKACIENLKITVEHLTKWGIGGDGNNTCFLIQTKLKCLNVKKIDYKINCKRNKDKPPYSLSAGKNKKYLTCLFGQHLLSEDKIICVVESEKSAVVASFFYPQYDWLATGGSNGLTVDKVQVLIGRNIFYLNDADNAGKDNSTIKKLIGYNIPHKIVDLFPERNDGYDLADAIFDNQRPVIEPVVANSTVAENIKLKTKFDKEKSSLDAFGFFEKENSYWIKVYLKNSTKDQRISNFKMKLLYRLNDGSEYVIHIYEFTKENGSTMILEINSKDLFNANTFSALILKGGYNYTGTSIIFKNVVESLFEDSKEAVYISSLGQNIENDFYAFYNGVLTTDGKFIQCNEHGIIDFNGKLFYLPSGKAGNENSEEYFDDRKFKLVDGAITLENFIDKTYNIYQISGLVGLCYTIATIHRDIIFSETRFFPFLFLYGGKGSGKSTYLNFFMHFFGEPQPETTENSTDKAIERKFSQINNNVQYIKEFSPTFEEILKNILKNAYDGVGYSRAQVSQNNKTKTLSVRSGIFIDGNYFPTQDDALFSRLLFLNWNPKVNVSSKNQIQEIQDLLTKGSGLIFKDIYTLRPKYKNKFSKVYREKVEEIKVNYKDKKYLFSEREISHIAILLSVFSMSILDIYLSVEAYNLFKECLIDDAIKQKSVAKSIDLVNKFFETMESLYQKGVLVDQKHFIREQGISSDFLFIDYNLCQVDYAELMRKTGDRSHISKEELKQKLIFNVSKTYKYSNPNEVNIQKKFSGQNKRCFVFDVFPGSFELSNI